MGCSLVTIFEVLHHIILIFLRTSVKSVNRIHKTIRCAPRNEATPSGITMAAFMQLGSNINVFAPNPGKSTPIFLQVNYVLTLHTCLYEGVEPMNYARYIAGTLVKSTLKLTRIY